MFGIGWTELLVIAIVAIIVVGPKDLPRLMRSFGYYAGKFRRMANEFKQQVDEAMREDELVEVRKAIEILRNPSRTFDLNAPIDGNLMLPKQHAVAKPCVNSEARAPVVRERAAPRLRRTRRKAGGASSPKKRTAPKCSRSAAP
jgi:sec-independent protein translocase protein TatB